MKKILTALISIFIILGFSACGININSDFNIDDYTNTLKSSDRIDVMKDDQRIDMISGHNNLEDFISALKLEEWEIKDLPKDAETNGEFIMFKGQKKKTNNEDVKFNKVAEIATYKDLPYVTLRISKIEFNFKVPADVEDYINTFIY